MEKKLYDSSLTGNVQALNALIQEDQLILDRVLLTSFNETPLHIAAMRGHLDFARVVLVHKPRLSTAVDSLRRTPLHLASAGGHVEIVAELLRVTSRDICRFRDQDGMTPLHTAAINEQLEVIEALVQADSGAAKEVPENGKTILHVCVDYNRFEAFKVLANLWDEEELAKLMDQDGNTLLHAAAVNKHTQILNYLLKKSCIKANGNAVNRHGFTALDVLDHIPRDFKALETREILMKAGVMRANDLRPLPPSEKLSKAIANHPKKQKGFFSRAWDRYSNNDRSWLEKQRGILIVAALVVAAMAFNTGINPPGGTITNTNNGRYELGNAVQTEVDMDNFNQFVTYNTFTMIISLFIVLLLISGFPLGNKFVMWLLTLGTLFNVVFMVATYLQSVAIMSPDMWINSTTIWICLIWMLACGVMALIHTIFFIVWVVKKLSNSMKPGSKRTRNQDVVEV